MKFLLALICVGSFLLRFEVAAQDESENSVAEHSTNETLENSPNDQPQNRISVQQIRLRTQDILRFNNLDAISTQSMALRKIEPNICDRLRSYLEQQFRQFYETGIQEVRKLSSILSNSNSEKAGEAADDVKNAATKFYTELKDSAIAFFQGINANCSDLGAIDLTTLHTISEQIEDLRDKQLNAAIALTNFPGIYEKQMQAYYKPVEDIIKPM